jgi:hypothetical protein
MVEKTLTDIVSDENILSIGIEHYNLKLIYSSKEFKKNIENYVKEQLDTHQKYYTIIDKKLSSQRKELYALQDRISNLDRIAEITPKPILELCLDIARIISAPIYWMHFKTIKGSLIKKIETENTLLKSYKKMKKIIDYGNTFIDDISTDSNKEVPEKIRNDLNEWKKVQNELAWIYTSMTLNSERRIESIKKMYNRFFPKFKI